MRGYVIDTQTVCYWFDDQAPEHANVWAHIRKVPADWPLMVSVITLGEIEYGHCLTQAPDLPKQKEFRKFIQETFPEPLQITESTPPYYAQIRALLFQKYPPQGKKTHPEQCYDPSTGSELGIDENDLWIASQAYEHNLVLVTNDKMKRIRAVTGTLLDIENWTDPP